MVAIGIQTIVHGPPDPEGGVTDVAVGGAAAVGVVPVEDAVWAAAAATQAARAGPGTGRADGLVASSAADIAFHTEDAAAVDTAALAGATHRLAAVVTALHTVGA